MAFYRVVSKDCSAHIHSFFHLSISKRGLSSIDQFQSFADPNEMKNLILYSLVLLFTSCSQIQPQQNRQIANAQEETIELNRVVKVDASDIERYFRKNERKDWSSLEKQLDTYSESFLEKSANLYDLVLKNLGAPDGDERLEWIRSTDWIMTINGYVEEASNDDGNLYTALNRALRQGKPLSADLKKYDAELRAALKKLPNIEGYTFRGATWSEKELEKYVVGGVVTELGYFSTSLVAGVAKRFSRLSASAKPNRMSVLYLVKAKTGKPVSIFSEYWVEMESLIAGGTKFRVIDKSPVLENRRIYIVLEEI